MLETLWNEGVSCMPVFEWFKRFGEVHDVEDDPRSSQLTPQNPQTGAKIYELVVRYCGMAIKLVEDQGTLTERLFVRFFMKIWERGKFVLHSFMGEQKEHSHNT